VKKLLYKPLSLATGIAGGILASVVFKQVWKHIADEPDPPDATDQDKGWGEVLTAAALQGAIFALVKAAVDRGGAVGVKRLSGTWPA
jgi:predicted metal-dependent enzyme (double-stranded beta helix superfamily)